MFIKDGFIRKGYFYKRVGAIGDAFMGGMIAAVYI